MTGAPVKKYMLVLNAKHQYTTAMLKLAEAQKKHPDSIKTLEPGAILYSQDKIFDIEQISETKTEGFCYSWGFGPCTTTIPFEKIDFVKVEKFNV